MSKRVEKLLKLTVGEVREQLAYMDTDLGIKEWLYDYAELPDDEDDLLEDLYDDENDDYCDDDYDDEDYDDEDEEEEIEVGGALPNPDEEELANQIANDISNRRYSINSLAGLYSADFIIRVQDLLR